MGVPTSKRVRSRNDFQKIRSLGKQVFCKSFIRRYTLRLNEQPTNRRLGVIASRRVGNAVKRNRGKRVFRELFRIHEAKLPSNCDIVIILRSGYSNYTFEELESHYIKTCTVISQIDELIKICKKVSMLNSQKKTQLTLRLSFPREKSEAILV